MPVQRAATIAAGAGFTAVRATIPVHYLKVYRNADRNAAAIEYQLPDDAFATTYTTDASSGDIIELLGHGRSGLLGVPPGFNAVGAPALGTELIRLRSADSAEITVTVYESESDL